MKKLINKEGKYIEFIGKFLYIEKFDDGTEFYCLLDKNGNVNTLDTGKTYNEIKDRIDFWTKLVLQGTICVR